MKSFGLYRIFNVEEEQRDMLETSLPINKTCAKIHYYGALTESDALLLSWPFPLEPLGQESWLPNAVRYDVKRVLFRRAQTSEYLTDRDVVLRANVLQVQTRHRLQNN